MFPNLPLPLNHSWPLFDARERLGLYLPEPSLPGMMPPYRCPEQLDSELATRGMGIWDCDLSDDRVTWSSGVYDLFGLPRGIALERGLAVSLYTPASRQVMEELRAYAIRHRRGFTVDTQLRQPGGEHRWMRLSALPVLAQGKVVRLRGVKADVTAYYDGAPAGALRALSLSPARPICGG